ncbi:MAG: pyridoxine 5'-phosphate synthase, partial [Gemmatimonadota bacterium]|nr:pyridoxine 5'-phosphate synthase [Gemmatimonadota bacterium]
DLEILRSTVQTHLNLEMASSDEIVEIALRVLPDQATLVPEKREEVTTEGGLDVLLYMDDLTKVVKRLREAGIMVSLFIDPEPEMIHASRKIGADAVELHTGAYANTRTAPGRNHELGKLKESATLASGLELAVIAGHGLTYTNILPIKTIPELEEVNIGHTIVSRAVLVGMERAVREMKKLLER